ncbi:hypothetical protein [Agromyces allii]|uniref:hypothetical protein n=1 Tax=Agromyces allii TaxID=393607 RepID=UPI0012F91D7F|nr:hypothetical protein [Agromyces allii]
MLYGVRWSAYITEPVAALLPFVIVVVLGTVVGFTLLGGRLLSGRPDRLRLDRALSVGNRLTPLFRQVFWVWIAIAVAEIALEGTPPLVRSLLGQNSDYLQFGVTSIHGLLLAMACAIALIEQAVRLNQGRQPIGPYTLVIVFWMILIIGRKHLIILAIQLVLLLLARRVIRASFAHMIRWGAAILALVFLFGFLGDFRSSAGVGIKEKLAYSGPDWVPDAFVWFYSYLVTPIANWQNAYAHGYAGDAPFPWKAFSGLLPSAFEGSSQVDVEGGTAYSTAPWLLTSSFNISTGYIVPLVEAGLVGVFLFTVAISLFSALLLARAKDMAGGLSFIVSYQCAVLMIFSNNFGNLNTVFQIPILVLLGRWMIDSSRESVPHKLKGEAEPRYAP